MKNLKSILFLCVLLIAFSNCQKEEALVIDEPVIEDPVIVDPVIDDPVIVDENEDEDKECLVTSILLREKARIDIEYRESGDEIELSKISLIKDGQSIARGYADIPNAIVWYSNQGRGIGIVERNEFGLYRQSEFYGLDLSKSIARSFDYENGRLVKITELNNVNGDEKESTFKYDQDGTLRAMSVTKNGRPQPHKSKEFVSFDSNQNPFADIGLFMLDFPEFFSDMFWPTANNPLLIEESIKGEISYKYEYSEIGFPLKVASTFELNDRSITNRHSANYDCN